MENLSPEMLEQLIALGAEPDKQRLLLEQMAQAQAMRQQPIPKGGMAGRVYVADPLGSAAAGLDRVMGHRQYKNLEGKYGKSLDNQTAGRKTYAQALINSLRGAQNPSVQTFPVE